MRLFEPSGKLRDAIDVVRLGCRGLPLPVVAWRVDSRLCRGQFVAQLVERILQIGVGPLSALGSSPFSAGGVLVMDIADSAESRGGKGGDHDRGAKRTAQNESQGISRRAQAAAPDHIQ